MGDKLKPCPFCGCRDCSGTVKIKCPQCGASGSYAPSEEDAVKKWNKRSRIERPNMNTDGHCRKCNTQLGHDDDGGSICRFCDAEPSTDKSDKDGLRELLEVLKSISSMGHGKGNRGAVIVSTQMLAKIADAAIAKYDTQERK